MDKSPTVQVLEDFTEIRRHLNVIALRDLRPLGIGQKQALILRCLSKNPNSSLADLSRATLSDPAAVTRAIDSLEKAEWVVKTEHPSDRRRWVLTLTATGKKKMGAVDELARNIAKIMVKELGKGEIETLAKLLSKIKIPLAVLTEGQAIEAEDDF